MQYNLKDLISTEHILLNLNASNSQETINSMAHVLERSGCVTKEFALDVWNREKKYPTGLPTVPFGIAIPHADPDHILKTSLCIATLKKPVKFKQMGTDNSIDIDVKAIFLLAIKEREKQVEMIQELINLIQKPDFLSKMISVKDKQEIVYLLKG